MRESDLERILCKEVNKEGGRTFKWVSPGNNGVPDRIVFFPGGEVYFVELKSDNGRLRRTQEIQIGTLQELGQATFVVRGMRGLVEFFRKIERGYIADQLEDRYGDLLY